MSDATGAAGGPRPLGSREPAVPPRRPQASGTMQKGGKVVRDLTSEGGGQRNHMDLQAKLAMGAMKKLQEREKRQFASSGQPSGVRPGYRRAGEWPAVKVADTSGYGSDSEVTSRSQVSDEDEVSEEPVRSFSNPETDKAKELFLRFMKDDEFASNVLSQVKQEPADKVQEPTKKKSSFFARAGRAVRGTLGGGPKKPPSMSRAPLAEVMAAQRASGDDSPVPRILQVCAGPIREGVTTEGIFRLSASRTRQQEIMEKLERGEDVSNQLRGEPILAAAVMKQCLRDMHESVIPRGPDGAPSRLQAALAPPDGGAPDPARVREAIRELPVDSQNLIRFLADLSREVAQHVDQNKMGLENLAIVMAPNLFEASEDPMELVTEADIQKEAITYIFENVDRLL